MLLLSNNSNQGLAKSLVLLLLRLLLVISTLSSSSSSTTTAQAQNNNNINNCTLCPDGSNVATPNRIIPFLSLDENVTDPTCLDYDNYARTQPISSFGCRLAQAQAGYCGCPNIDYVDACKLCGNNDNNGNGNNDNSDAMNNNNTNEITKPTKRSPSEGDLCSDIADYTRYLTPEACVDTRGTTILAHAALCGCPGVEAECSLCPTTTDTTDIDEGIIVTTEVPNPDLEVVDGTCGELFDLFQTVSKSTCESSQRLIQVNGVRCGCRHPSEFPECSIRQHEELCTKELLDSVVLDDDEVFCECYNFCGDEFLGCQDFPGKMLDEEEECPNGRVLITGCNYAGVAEPMESSTSSSPPLGVAKTFWQVVISMFLSFGSMFF